MVKIVTKTYIIVWGNHHLLNEHELKQDGVPVLEPGRVGDLGHTCFLLKHPLCLRDKANLSLWHPHIARQEFAFLPTFEFPQENDEQLLS